jgi:outer membrane protein OmpA-like peptidoglycan-associated protein
MRRAGFATSLATRLAIPRAILGLAALTASAIATGAMAQINSAPNTVPGTEANPFPVIEMQSNYGERPDHYRHLPFRDLATSISIQLPAGALYDFNVMAVRANAADYLQQAANLIYEHAAGPVKIECRSDRGAPQAAQKLATQCALAISQWLTTQEKLKVKFVTVGTAVPPPAPPDPRDLMPKASPSQSNITIDFAKK